MSRISFFVVLVRAKMKVNKNTIQAQLKVDNILETDPFLHTISIVNISFKFKD